MSGILSAFVPIFLRFSISLLLKNATVKEVFGLIQEAETKDTNSFGKRGFVYRALKSREETLSENTINAIIEMGVAVMKRKKGKK